MGSIFNIYDIVLLSVAILILRRLVSILGVTQDISTDDRPMKIVTPIDNANVSKSNGIKLLKSCKSFLHKTTKPETDFHLSEDSIKLINKMKERDLTFELRRFVKSVISEYSKVMTLMNKLEITEIKKHCCDKVFSEIEDYILYNKSRGFIVQQSLSKYELIEITDLKTIDTADFITAKFVMNIARSVYNTDGELVSGDEVDPVISSEEITFKRNNINSAWKIYKLGSSLTSNEI